MIELGLDGQRLEGMPLGWNEEQVHLLGRDGRLWQFAPAAASDFKQISDHFRAYSPSEFRAVLLRELGGGYEVSGTGHYLIAHPRNERNKWAQRFEDLYRSFVHYFSVRGLQPAPPAVPLVGVVCRNRAEFARLAAEEGNAAPGGVLGYYNHRLESDQSVRHGRPGRLGQLAAKRGRADSRGHPSNGVQHGRSQPLRAAAAWLAEGLAMLFEAPGVYDAHNNTCPADRVNQDRLRGFRQGVAPQAPAPVAGRDGGLRRVVSHESRGGLRRGLGTELLPRRDGPAQILPTT